MASAVAFMAWACAPAEPVSRSTITQYTGLELCADVDVRDLTTPQERDTVPGFSFHVELGMTPQCRQAFERQLAEMGCSATLTPAHGCHVEDASGHGRTRHHASIMVRPLSNGRYDLRVYQ